MNLRNIASGIYKRALYGNDPSQTNSVRGIVSSALNGPTNRDVVAAGYAQGNPWFGHPDDEERLRHAYDGLRALLPERPEVRQARLARERRMRFINPNTNTPLPEGWDWVDPAIARRFHIPRTARNVRFYRDAGGNLQVHSYTPTTPEEIARFQEIADQRNIRNQMGNEYGDKFIQYNNGRYDWHFSQTNHNSPMNQMKNAIRASRVAALINGDPHEFLRRVKLAPNSVHGSMEVDGGILGGQTPEAQALMRQLNAYTRGDFKHREKIDVPTLTPEQLADYKLRYGIDRYVDNNRDKAFIEQAKKLGVDITNYEQIQREREAQSRAREQASLRTRYSQGYPQPGRDAILRAKTRGGANIYRTTPQQPAPQPQTYNPRAVVPIARGVMEERARQAQQAAPQPQAYNPGPVVPIARGVMQQRAQQRPAVPPTQPTAAGVRQVSTGARPAATPIRGTAGNKVVARRGVNKAKARGRV